MDDTTLIITSWHRPDYLRQVLASWAAVPEVKSLRRIIVKLGRSDRWDEQIDVIAESGLDVEVQPDSEAAAAVRGEHTALGEAVTAAFASDSGCEFIIHSSEDVIVSDDVLRYFAWARQGDNLLAVCAHNYLGQGWNEPVNDHNADQSIVRAVPEFSPWVWGFWRESWEEVFEPEWCWSAEEDGTGWDWSVKWIVDRGYRVAIPDASRGKNIGEYGGVYGLPEKYKESVARSFRKKRGKVAYRWA